jgi:putative hydrolase of the HAD superfamily
VTPRQLLLDYAQVISIPQTAEDIAGLAALAGLPTEEFTSRYWAHRAPYDRGGSAPAYWAAVLGVAPTADRLIRLVEYDSRSWLRLDPAVLAVLDGFHRAGIAVSLLSNLPRELAAAVAALPAFTPFRQLLFSFELGMVKPDPRIFTAAAARLDAAPGEVLFVDDRSENVRAATTVGMHAVTYTGTADCLARLHRRLLPG